MRTLASMVITIQVPKSIIDRLDKIIDWLPMGGRSPLCLRYSDGTIVVEVLDPPSLCSDYTTMVDPEKVYGIINSTKVSRESIRVIADKIYGVYEKIPKPALRVRANVNAIIRVFSPVHIYYKYIRPNIYVYAPYYDHSLYIYKYSDMVRVFFNKDRVDFKATGIMTRDDIEFGITMFAKTVYAIPKLLEYVVGVSGRS